MSNEEKDIFDSLGEKLEKQQFEFNPDHWSDMESRLDNEPVPEPAGRKRRRGILWISLAGLLGALFLSIFQWVRHDDVAVNNTPESEQNIAVVSEHNKTESTSENSRPEQNGKQQESRADQSETSKDDDANDDIPVVSSASDASSTGVGNDTENSHSATPAETLPSVNTDEKAISVSTEEQNTSSGDEDKATKDLPAVNGGGLTVLPVVADTKKHADSEQETESSSSENATEETMREEHSANENTTHAVRSAAKPNLEQNTTKEVVKNAGVAVLPMNGDEVKTTLEQDEEIKNAEAENTENTSSDEQQMEDVGHESAQRTTGSEDGGLTKTDNEENDVSTSDNFSTLNQLAEEESETMNPVASIDSVDVPEDSVADIDELLADSSLAEEDEDSDDPELWSALRLYGGVNLLKGYTNNSETQALERNGVAANAHVGLLFARDLTGKLGTLGGISYYQRSQLNYTRNIINVKYDFGRTEERMTISTEKLHFIRFSLGGYYNITDHLSVSAMASADRLLTARNNITTEAEGVTQETKDYGYTSGYEILSYALSGGVQYRLTDRLNLGALYTHGLTNIITTGTIAPSSGSENSGVQLYLTYDVVKRKKENHE